MTERKPSENEMHILERLLSEDFPGASDLAKQLERAWVNQIDDNGSLKFTLPVDTPIAAVNKRIPVEATCIDRDGMTINVLLHVVDGLLDELEIYRDDSMSVVGSIEPSELCTMTLP